MAETGASPSPHKSALHFLQANCMLLTGGLGRQRLLHLLPQVQSLTQFCSVNPLEKRISVKKKACKKRQNQGLCQLFLMLLQDLYAQRGKTRSVLFSLQFQKQGTGQGPCPHPLKGAMSAQNALQGSKTETRELVGGTKQKYILLD